MQKDWKTSQSNNNFQFSFFHFWNLSNPDTNGAEERGVLISDVEMHARVVLGVGKGVLFREVSS